MSARRSDTLATTSPYADAQRTLAAIAPDAPHAAARAEVMLPRLLRDIESSPCPEYAWIASRLTGDGHPVEFTFTSRDDTVRYTVAACVDEPPARASAAALELVDELGERPMPRAVADALLRLTDGPCDPAPEPWIGVRHVEDPTVPDRLKIYVQPADERRPTTGLVCEPGPTLQEREVRLRLYGYEPATGVHERYFRVRRLLPHQLAAVMRQAGVGDRAAELVDMLRRAYRHPLDGAIPGGSVGFSIAGSPSGGTLFTLFVFARALWGGDARIRLAIARLAAEHGWSMQAYERASAPLAGRDVHATYHGMVGFLVSAGEPIQLAIGLRPPPHDTGA